MEPCLFRHGKFGKVAGHMDRCPASMEPCLFRHGKVLPWRAIKRDLHLASMEPCLFRHGKDTVENQNAREFSGFNGAMSFQTW